MPKTDSQKKYDRAVTSWCLYDWANSAFATTVMAAVLPIYYSQVAGVNLPGNTATVYWGYTTVIALLITAFLAPIMGVIADITGTKKRFLMIYASLGILATALLYFVTTGDWALASAFFIIGNVGFAMSEVFYNSLLPHVATPEDVDRVSTRGYAIGYLGGGTLLGINVLMIQLMADKELATRLSFISVSVWWAIFTIPLLLNVSEPPVVAKKYSSSTVITGFKTLRKSFKDLRKHKELFLFLVAFWIYNDGIGTIIKMATIYGAEIGISQSSLIGALLMTQFVGIPFSILFGRLAGYIGTKNSILLGLIVYTFISISGYFIQTALHFWILAFMVATVQGGTQALSRSLFSSMLPKSKACEFFGFYGMSSKFAGIIGPLVFAVVSQLTGSSRLSIISLIIFFIIGGAVLYLVDEKKGVAQARNESRI